MDEERNDIQDEKTYQERLLEPMDLDIDIPEVPVRFRSKDGTIQNLKLKGLSGKERDKFLNAGRNNVKVVQGQPVGLLNYTGFQSRLLCKTLYDENDELVSMEKIEEFPSGVQTKLYIRSCKLSGLDEESVEEAKKN